MSAPFPKYKVVTWGNIRGGPSKYGIAIRLDAASRWMNVASGGAAVLHDTQADAMKDIREMKAKQETRHATER